MSRPFRVALTSFIIPKIFRRSLSVLIHHEFVSSALHQSMNDKRSFFLSPFAICITNTSEAVHFVKRSSPTWWAISLFKAWKWKSTNGSWKAEERVEQKLINIPPIDDWSAPKGCETKSALRCSRQQNQHEKRRSSRETDRSRIDLMWSLRKSEIEVDQRERRGGKLEMLRLLNCN